MQRSDLNHPIDLNRIEVEARRLRAQALADSMTSLKRWVAAPFHRRSVI